MKIIVKIVAIAAGMLACVTASAQYRDDVAIPETNPSDTVVLTLDDALRIALSENVSVKVADQEIMRTQYARKGTYASLFPQVDFSGNYQRTIKKQVMYMDFDMSAFGGGGSDSGSDSGSGSGTGSGSGSVSGESGNGDSSDTPEMPSSGGGIEVGRWNTYSGGITATMPIVNAQLWKSLAITGNEVELAVEKARSSRLDMVTQVKQAYYAVLLAKEAFSTYKDVYENAMENFSQTEKKYRAEKASELDYTRAKVNVANAIPNVYNAESQVNLALWQLKAVMGVDLDRNIDVAGTMGDFASEMNVAVQPDDSLDLSGNSSLRQLEIQADELANTVRMRKYAYLPTLGVSFAYNMIAMTNDFNFSEYKWSPYSYVGLSLTIPIFSGGKRYNDVRQAKVQQTQLSLQRQDTERQLRIAIRQYLTTMDTQKRSYSSAKEASDLAQKAYDISQKSYSVGKSTLTDLNDAQLSLTQAELGVSQAVYNWLVAKSNLEKTIGYDFLDENGETNLDESYLNNRN